MRAKKRGPGPSSTLITPDRAGNVVGVDPHKRDFVSDDRRFPRRDPDFRSW